MMCKEKRYITITQTNHLKFYAIMIVIISHYFRYADVESKLHFLASIGFFGASLFAFLSGYGVTASYLKNGIGRGTWLFNKLKKVYFPFVFVNIIAVFTIYKNFNVSNMPVRLLFGTDDPIMWYIPFILAFYFVFWFINNVTSSQKIRSLLLTVCGAAWIYIGIAVGLGSQWYTSTGALIAGCFAAENDELLSQAKNRNIMIIASFMALVGFSYISRCYTSISIIKDLATIISGMAFVVLIFVIAGIISKNGFIKTDSAYNNCLSFIGRISLWIYIVHMKVMHFFMVAPKHKSLLFILLSCVTAYVLMKIYNTIESIIQKSSFSDKITGV